MNKLKLLYSAMAVTVVILIAYAGFTGIYKSLTKSNESATITTQAIIDVENFSIFHFDITNREGHATNYKICALFENATKCFWQPIENGKTFTYERYFYLEDKKQRKLTITVYKEDDPEPIENITGYV
jgi:putative lipase involved disintegration of autophagic bodies